ncbi:MAG: hypothetical protein WC532_01940 [Candidatus Omnitrophota bacterium]
MVNKRRLLITFDLRRFDEIFRPLVLQLAPEFRVSVLAIDCFAPPGTDRTLAQWQKEGLIEKYTAVPNISFYNSCALKMHLAMRRIVRQFKPLNFDLWVTVGETEIVERYISDCILPDRCVKIVLWPCLTRLLENKELVEKMLFSSNSIKRRNGMPEGLFNKIRQSGTPAELLRKITGLLKRKYMSLLKKISFYFDRFLVPWVMVGKTFGFGPHDRLTQLGSGRSEVIIFCDEVEAAAHKLLFKAPDVYAAYHPTYGNCRCQGDKKHANTLLVPLSVFVDYKRISEEYLSLFLRDLKTVLLNTGTAAVHLRRHPDDRGAWVYQLRDYLLLNSVNTEIVPCDKPIRDVMCDYRGMAGFASNALRDGRASCDYAYIIGFTAVSKGRYADPKFVFGNSEGIGWIEEDGSYNREIFTKYRHAFPERKKPIEIILSRANS